MQNRRSLSAVSLDINTCFMNDKLEDEGQIISRVRNW